MPEEPLRPLLDAAASWLQRRREVLSVADQSGGARFLPVWDRLAEIAYSAEADDSGSNNGNDLVTESLNRPGGILAWALLDAFSGRKPERDSGLTPEFRPRFDKIVEANGRPGLLGRVYLVRALSYFDAVDPQWTERNFWARLSWDNPEALSLWRSFAHSTIGSPRLFNALKAATLATFERKELPDQEFEAIASKLLSIGIWHQRGQAHEYHLTAAEIRRALTIGPPSVRRNIAWNLWRLMGEQGGEPADRATRWREVMGPLFASIWPLDARLRSADATRNLVLMALECEDAFPKAVDAIVDLIEPYELYQLSISLRLEDKHSELVRQYPSAFVKLVSALVDSQRFPIPSDLASFLEECVTADATVVDEPAYNRLYGLRRQRGA